MSNPLVFFFVVAVGVAADLWTKSAIFDRLSLHGQEEVIEGFLYWAPILNPGAAWSLFQNVPSVGWVIFRGLVVLMILGFYFSQKGLPTYARLGFAAIVSGALGNLHDNAFTDHGQVRDFIRCVFGSWAFPTFNVADSLITLGGITLGIYFLLHEPRRSGAVKGSPEANGT